MDNVQHYFVNCALVTPFWNHVTKWLKDRLQIQELHLDEKCIVLGYLETKKFSEAVNFVLLNAKWFIHQRKIKNQNINFKAFESILQNRLQIEKLRYKMNSREDTFNEIFNKIL